MARNGRSGNGHSARRRRMRRNLRYVGASAGVPRLWAAGIALAGLGLVAALAGLIASLVLYRGYADELVAPDDLAINKPSYGARIYDRNGALLYEYVDDYSGLRRPVHLEGVSEAFLAATISTEDDSFFTNPGVNVKGLARAAWENFSPLSGTPGVLGGSGGSSITQQLVKNVYIAEEERQKRSVSRKLKETVYAIELTQRYDKDQILEWYVNQISYGGVYNGVEAASQGYFGKPAKELTLAEAALLAGIPQSPAAYDPVNNRAAAAARRNEILDLLERKGKIRIGADKYFEASREDIEAAKAEEVSIAQKRFPIRAPHFVLNHVDSQLRTLLGCPLLPDLVVDDITGLRRPPKPGERCPALLREGLVVTTTLDVELQATAERVLERWIGEFEGVSNSRNGAAIVIEPSTGEILTMVGSRDYFRDDIEGRNNNATALNSPGSAFKPFVYMMSFMKLGWGPGTVLLDTPVTYVQPDGKEFKPVNPGKNFQGPISLRKALGNSLNVPANKTADAVGVDYIVEWAKKLGFTTLGGGGYGPAIATGGVDLTPLEMTYAYSVLANGGVMKGQTPLLRRRAGERNLDPIAILKVTDAAGRLRFDVNQRRGEERIVQEEFTYLIAEILSDGSAQCITFGCGGITVPGRQVAVKTGTSEPFDPEGPDAGKIGDTWGFGYTPDIVVGVWAGNANNAPIVNIFSTSISFRAMRDILLGWYDGRPSTPFHRPEGIVEETVCVPSGKRPSALCGRTTRDLFVQDTLTAEQDNWWRRVLIDGRTNLLAGPGTPSQYAVEKVMLVLPAELLRTEEDRRRAQEWADVLGIPLAPLQVSQGVGGAPSGGGSADLPAVIFSPTPGQVVRGPVPINGRASSSAFLSYRLEYGSGIAPTNWTPISQSTQPVPSGPLGTWNPGVLPDGIYTVRLAVLDGSRGMITASVTVNLTRATPTPPVSRTPVAAP